MCETRVFPSGSQLMWAAALLSSCITLTLEAQQVTSHRFLLSGEVKPSSALTAIHIAFDGSERLHQCWTEFSSKGILQCKHEIEAEASPRAVRVEITQRGRKRFVLNIPRLEWVREGDAMVSRNFIGVVKLERSALPEISKIVRTEGADGSLGFEIVFKNAYRRSFLVTDMRIEGRRRRAFRSLSCYEVVVSYCVSDLLLLGLSEKGKLSGEGRFIELKRGGDFKAKYVAEYDPLGCSGSSDDLDFRFTEMAFEIPSSKFSAIKITLPAKMRFFRHEGPLYDLGDYLWNYPWGSLESLRYLPTLLCPPVNSNSDPAKADATVDLTLFEAFEFTFLSSEDDELEISARSPADLLFWF